MSRVSTGSPLRKMWQRFGVSDAQFEAQELQESSRGAGATAIGECACGEVVTVCGPLRSVTLHPVAGLPAVEAELYDGSGAVSLVWMGRRRIRGIEPGRVLTATGRLGAVHGSRVIYNPRYSLRPLAVAE